MPDLFTLIRVTDTETTDLDDPAEMVEIGWTDVRFFPQGWAIESGPHSHIVNPGMPIKPGARAAHRLSDADVRHGILPQQARDIIENGADYVACHNLAFDSRFLKTRKPSICTMKVAKSLWPEAPGFSNQTIRYWRELCLSAADMAKAMPPHRAGPDSFVTAHILIDELKLMSPGQMVYASDQPSLLMICKLKKHFGQKWSEVPLDYLNWVLFTSDMPSDPDKADVVFTARHWLKKRTGA